MPIISLDQIQEKLAQLEGWTFDAEKDVLRKTFKFKGFTEAVEFIGKLPAVANALNHHPDVHLVNYNKVIVESTTHDAGNQVGLLDLQLAKKINAMQ